MPEVEQRASSVPGNCAKAGPHSQSLRKGFGLFHLLRHPQHLDSGMCATKIPAEQKMRSVSKGGAERGRGDDEEERLLAVKM